MLEADELGDGDGDNGGGAEDDAPGVSAFPWAGVWQQMSSEN